MDEGAVERRYAGHARVDCAISISGPGERVSLRLTVDQERPEKCQQERGAWTRGESINYACDGLL